MYGLRDLQSFGLLPIKKPYLKFDIKSLLTPERALAATNTITTPATGANPNINAQINMTCMLPVDWHYTPYMTVDVYDHIYTGDHQPLIGTFHIMIGDIKEAQT